MKVFIFGSVKVYMPLSDNAVMNMKVEISRSNAYIPKEVTSDPFAILIG